MIGPATLVIDRPAIDRTFLPTEGFRAGVISEWLTFGRTPEWLRSIFKTQH